jgi:DNA-binding NarL/FixJ family response regulator
MVDADTSLQDGSCRGLPPASAGSFRTALAARRTTLHMTIRAAWQRKGITGVDAMSTNTNHPDVLAPCPQGTLAEIGQELSGRPYVRRGVAARTEPIRVVLVDDHHLVRSGLKAILRGCTDIVVIGEADGGHTAVSLATRLQPEVIVMDLDMPDGDGLSATRALQAASPRSLVLIVTMSAEDEKLLPALEAGARGFLCKSAADRELVDAIRVVAAGDVYVRPAVARALAGSSTDSPPQRDDARSRLERLSDRERSVVLLTARGFNGPEIGRQLGITAKTVDTYKQRIEEKLGLSHRTDYVRIALDANLLA